jgi:hypothetical protein
MRRREFIMLLGATAAWPLAECAAAGDAGGRIYPRPTDCCLPKDK